MIRARHLHAAVGDRAVRAEQVDRVDLERADAHRQDRDRRCSDSVRPKSLVRSKTWSRPVMIVALMAGMLSENWSAERSRTGPRSSLSAWVGMKPPPKLVVTSMNIVAAVSVLSSMPISVVDRLDRRPGLAPAVGQDVELGLELLVALGRVAGRADVGQDLAGPVVDDRGRGVVDVVAAQAEDPRSRPGRDLAAGEDRRRVLGIRARGRRRRPTSRRSAACCSRAS